MKKLIAIALLISASGNADALSVDDYCTTLADQAYVSAQYRDKGMSRFAMRNSIQQSDYAPERKEQALIAVDLVFKRPYLSPPDEAEKVYAFCKDQLAHLEGDAI